MERGTEHHALHIIYGSHPCVAVECALQLKNQVWTTREVVPPTQVLVMRRRFGAPTVPAIEFANGDRVQGSRAIMQRLDELVPEPPLYSSDPDIRRRADEAEAWGDSELQMIARRLLFAGFRRNKGVMHTYQAGARIRFPRIVTRIAAPVVIAGEWRVHGMTSEQIRRDIDELPQTFDRIDHWIADGVLDNGQTSAADLQVAASLRLLLTMRDVSDRFGDRPAAQMALRLIPEYDGEMPIGTLG